MWEAEVQPHLHHAKAGCTKTMINNKQLLRLLPHPLAMLPMRTTNDPNAGDPTAGNPTAGEPALASLNPYVVLWFIMM